MAPVKDQNGEEILALPAGFRYVTFSKIGDRMTDGNPTPANLDGMGAFPCADDAVRLIRNHEVGRHPGEDQPALLGPEGTRYDPSGVGGTVTVDFDPRSLVDARRYPPVLRDFISLNGTIVNCAGGYACRDAGWISCEESIAGLREGWLRKHGYAFLVPAAAAATVMAEPIRGMGRFKHEAAVAAPRSGIIYETEDAGRGVGSGFYRYLPREPADLRAGGTLQMLRVPGYPQADMRQGQQLGRRLDVDWVTIDAPDPDLENGAPGTFEQGFARGGALFNRLEGIFRGEQESIYFVSTSGGNAKNGNIDADGYAQGYGQIWRYLPGAERHSLVLVFESPGRGALKSPDNIAVTPRGGLICCEDDVGRAPHGRDDVAGTSRANRLIGLTLESEAFEFARNCLNSTELAGVCFSPRGDVLFVNIYGNGTPASGMSCAITGPWGRGPL